MVESDARILYTLRSFEPKSHRGSFSLEIRGITGPEVEIVLPVWAPGAYELRESAREVGEVSARSAAGAVRELTVERRAKNRWRVVTQGAAAVEFLYSVYGHDLLDDGIDFTDEHAFLNATRCLPWVAGREAEPVEIVLNLPAGWSAHAELPRLGEHPVRFRAPNYEALVDAPIDAGRPTVLTLHPAGIPHHIVICGGPGNYELHRLEQDVARIVEAQIRYVGSSPLASFTFFLHLHDRRDGGLEHANSTSLVVERSSFKPRESYDRFLTLVSHEYFHLYNVKRIRPKVLGPFDFDRENYTRLLWWMEGTTDYAAGLLVRRAGLFTPSAYLQYLAEKVRLLLASPGRHHRSAEEASYLAWIDRYRPYEETQNQSVDYYVKGHVASACLDLELRARTENRLGLEDVVRHLWAEYGRTGRGLEEGELPSVVERVSGIDLGSFFARYIAGTEDPPIAEAARHAGLAFGPAPKPAPNGIEPTEPAYLGVELRSEGDRARIAEVRDGTPARRAGLSPGDEVVALDGYRVLFAGFGEALKRYAPGEEVKVDLFRRGVLRRVPVVVGSPPPAKYAFTPLEDPPMLARQIYARWLEAPWEPASAPAISRPKI